MKVIVTESSVDIYREDMPLSECPGTSCREFAQWMMAWAMLRLAQESKASIAEPGTQRCALCD